MDSSMKEQEAALEREKGNECFKKSEFLRALSHYDRGIVCTNTQPALFCNRAIVLIRLGRFREAKADCDKAVQLDPTYVKAYFRRATVLMRLGQPGYAEKDLCTVLALDPRNRDAQNQLEQLQKRKVSFKGDVGYEIIPKAVPVSNTADFTRISVSDRTENAERSIFVQEGSSKCPVNYGFETPLPAEVASTRFQFVRDWRSLENRPSELADYFLRIPIDRYRELFQEALDGQTLSLIIQSLSYKCRMSGVEPAEWNLEIKLVHLCRLPRFDVAAMFLSDSDRYELNHLFNQLSDSDELKKLRYEFCV